MILVGIYVAVVAIHTYLIGKFDPHNRKGRR